MNTIEELEERISELEAQVRQATEQASTAKSLAYALNEQVLRALRNLGDPKVIEDVVDELKNYT